MDWEDWCAQGAAPPIVCSDCGQQFAPDEIGEMDAHRDEHWFDYLRSLCPIPPPPAYVHRPLPVFDDITEEEVPF